MLQGGPAVASCTAGEGELSAAPVWIFLFWTTATLVACSIPVTGTDPIGPKLVVMMSTSGWFAAARTAASEKPSTKKITASGLAFRTAPVTAVPWPS